jgi:hypothetical protein
VEEKAPRSGRSTPQVEEKGTTQWRGSRGRSPLVKYVTLTSMIVI